MCPLCNLMVTGLARHMRRNLPGHGWSREKSKKAANILGIRKRRLNNTRMCDVRKHKSCPVKGCYALVTRLDQHLKRVHGRTSKTAGNINIDIPDDVTINEDLLSSFLSWGLSGDGGCLSDRTVKRQVEQLRRTTSLMKSNSSLHLVNDENQLNSFIAKKIDEGWSCRTATSYLFSIISLSNYVKSRHFEAWFRANEDDVPFDITQLKLNAISTGEASKRWCKSYAKKGRAAVHAKEENVRETLVTSDEANVCLNGPVQAQIKLIIVKHNQGILDKEISQSIDTFILFRDYIVLNLLVLNGHRSAIVYELSCEEFSRAKQFGKKILIKCKRHKTEGNYGAGDIIVRKPLYEVMKFYYDNLRPNLDGNRCPKYFISRNGTPFSSSQVAASAQSCWKKNGLDKNKKITPNVTRRSAATRVYELDPNQSVNAASLMLHSLKVHRKHYTKMDKEGAAFRGEETIHSAYFLPDSDDEVDSANSATDFSTIKQEQLVLREPLENENLSEDVEMVGNEQCENENQSEFVKDQETDERVDTSYIVDSDYSLSECDSTPVSPMLESDSSDDEVPSNPSTKKSNKEKPDPENRYMKVFSVSETEILRKLFADIIHRKCQCTKNIVKDRLESSKFPEEVAIVRKFKFSQIMDKIRWMKKSLK